MGVLQIGQIGHEGIVVRLIGGEGNLGDSVGNLLFAQIHGVNHGDIGVVPGVDLQGRVGGGAGGIQKGQVFIVFQLTHVFIGDNQLQLRGKIGGVRGLRRLGGGRGFLRGAPAAGERQQQEQRGENIGEFAQAHGVVASSKQNVATIPHSQVKSKKSE